MEKLQSKWLCDIVVKAFSVKGATAWEQTEEGLRAFMPRDFNPLIECINEKVGNVLKMIWAMLHRVVDLKSYLDRLSVVLSPVELGDDAKMLARIKNMTHFKKLQQACHASVANELLDTECNKLALTLQSNMPSLKKELLVDSETGHDFDFGTLTFLEILAHVSKIVDLNSQVAALPHGDNSQHVQVREEGKSLVASALNVLHKGLSLGPRNSSFKLVESLCCTTLNLYIK